MPSFSSLADYAAAFPAGAPGRSAVFIAGLRWRRHPGHTLVEYEFDARIGYHVPVREVRHEGCIASPDGQVYCPHCKAILPSAP